MTAEQLLDCPDLGRCELIKGELNQMTPAGADHGQTTLRLSLRLGNHVEQHQLGALFAAETGFLIARNPDTVRAPDVAFVRTERLPRVRTPGYFDGPPDLAVEVLSPNDRASDVLQKVQDWLASGCGQVWVVDPDSQTVSVYRTHGQTEILTGADQLTGGDVVADFTIRVAEIFAELNR